ncbi:MAG TPA: FN3 associated domain-containing protein, partial [Gaiellaceae bacterium]|nr:FN3 associated domain-containing protein [Gaiellaceae bacterium]
SASFTAQSDSTAPAGGALTANGTAATGGGSTSYLTSGTTLTIDSRTDYTETQTATASGLAGSTLTIQSATLSNNSCGSYGAPSTISGTTSQTVSSGHCYLLTLTGTDNVGNTATISTTVMVDTTAPSAPTTFGFSSLTNAYYPGSGSIVYFQGGSAGGFTATASGATDADTGIASYTYGAVAGAGWSNVAGVYSFTGISPTGTGSATATNGAGLTGSSTSFTAQSDSTAPTGGALTANGTAATGAGSTSYLTSGTTLTINSRTDYTDAGSGLASSTLTIQSAPLSGNSCGSYGSASTISGTTSQTVSSGNCYLLTLTGTDNVGNTASISTTVMVDTTAPSAPSSLAFSSPSHAYYPGSGSTIYFQGGAAGGFTVTASGSSDSESGVTGYTYPALGSGWSNTAGAYTFDSSAATQSGSVTAQNGAGVSSSGTSFTAQSDAAAPSSSLTCNGSACPGGWTSSVPVNIDINASDGGSGVASITYTTDGSDPTTSGTATTVNAATASFQISSVATIKWFSTDNVGNISSVSSQTVQLDTTPPAAPTGFTFSAATHAYWPGSGSTVYFQGGGSGGFTVAASGSTDSQSGVAGYTYPALGSGWSNTNGAYTFNSSAGTQSGSVTATDNAGNTGSGTSFTAQSDGSAPTSSVTCNSIACSAGWYTTSPVSVSITGNDSGSGVERIVYTTDGSAPAINGSDVVTNGTAVAGANASFNVTTLGSTTVKWLA